MLRFVLLLSVAVLVAHGADITTAQYDNNRTSWNSSETILNTANVNSAQFGKLHTRSLDGAVYAQPLYLEALPIPGHGTADVVFVCTANNTVYAFDADSGSISAPYWSVNLGAPDTTPSSLTSPNSEPSLGILSTPVIVRSSGTLYVTAATRENGHRVYRLHALDITSGAEKSGSPVVIAGQFPGTAWDAQGGLLTFNPDFHLQRASLAVAQGSVYIAMAGSRDIEPFHGWIFGYDLTTLAQTGVLNLTANGMEGGVWQSMRAPVVDSNGSLYLETGNGDYDGSSNFSNSVLRLNNGTQGLAVADWFTPDNWLNLSNNDLDLSSAGPVLIPGTNSLIAAGKTGTLYVVNSGNMGHEQSGNGQLLQLLQATPACSAGNCDFTNDPIFWNHATNPVLYIWAWNDVLRALPWTSGQLSVSPSSTNGTVSNYPGGELAGSSSGSLTGTGIVWALTGDSENAQAGLLSAYDASNLANLLWTSKMNSSRDALGLFAKNLPPLIANGKVFAGDFSGQLNVYGLLNGAPVPASVNLASSANPAIAGLAVTLTATVIPAAATGTVTFRDGSAALGTAAISNGTAALTGVTLSPGSHSLTAVYSGDMNYLSESASLTLPVNTAPSLAVPRVTLTRNASHSIVATIVIQNSGTAAAQNTVITSATIGGVRGTPLPSLIGVVMAGFTFPDLVTFPASAGSSGSSATVTISGTCIGGTFSYSANLILP